MHSKYSTVILIFTLAAGAFLTPVYGQTEDAASNKKIAEAKAKSEVAKAEAEAATAEAESKLKIAEAVAKTQNTAKEAEATVNKKIAEKEQAIINLETAKQTLRKVKADADKAASDAENAAAITVNTQDRDKRTADAAAEKVEIENLKTKVATIKDAFALPPGFKESIQRSPTSVSTESEILFNSNTIGKEIAKKIGQSTKAVLPKAVPIVCEPDSQAVVAWHTDNSLELVRKYSNAIDIALRLEQKKSGQLIKPDDNSRKDGMSDSLAAIGAAGVSAFINLASTAAQFAAALRPITSTTRNSSTQAFNVDAIKAQLATELALMSGVRYLDFENSVGSVSGFLGRRAVSEKISNFKLSTLLSRLYENNKNLTTPKGTDPNTEKQKGTEGVEVTKSMINSGTPTTSSPSQASVSNEINQFLQALETITIQEDAGKAKILDRLMQVETTLTNSPKPCLFWLKVKTQGFESDISSIQPAFSRQRNHIRSTGVIQWTLTASTGDIVAGDQYAETVNWKQIDPEK